MKKKITNYDSLEIDIYNRFAISWVTLSIRMPEKRMNFELHLN